MGLSIQDLQLQALIAAMAGTNLGLRLRPGRELARRNGPGSPRGEVLPLHAGLVGHAQRASEPGRDAGIARPHDAIHHGRGKLGIALDQGTPVQAGQGPRSRLRAPASRHFGRKIVARKGTVGDRRRLTAAAPAQRASRWKRGRVRRGQD